MKSILKTAAALATTIPVVCLTFVVAVNLIQVAPVMTLVGLAVIGCSLGYIACEIRNGK